MTQKTDGSIIIAAALIAAAIFFCSGDAGRFVMAVDATSAAVTRMDNQTGEIIRCYDLADGTQCVKFIGANQSVVNLRRQISN